MSPHIHPPHILFVDDELAAQRHVEKMLRAGIPGVRVTCAGDGAQALAVIDRGPIDLLITDLEMPVLDGIELLLQVARRGLLVPLLVVTGHGSPASERRALSSGAIEYFEKPIRPESFIRCVVELLLRGANGLPGGLPLGPARLDEGGPSSTGEPHAAGPELGDPVGPGKERAIVRGDEDGSAERGDEVVDAAAGVLVQVVRRLVEEDGRRILEEEAREAQAGHLAP